MATIRKRGSRWQVQVRRQGFPPISKSFLEKADAQRWAREREVAIDRGEFAKTAEDRSTTLKAILIRYEAEVSPFKRSASDHFHLRQIGQHEIGTVPVYSLTTEHVARFRDDRLKMVSGSTVRKEMNLLAHALKVARIEWRYPITSDLVSQVSKPPAGKARTRRVTEEELVKLREALQCCRNPLVRQVFLFALATGMRRGEVLGLSWANVCWTGKTAFLPLTKNGESRSVPLSPTALKVLQERKEQVSEDLTGSVFPISANALRLTWNRVLVRVSIENFRFHDLRHEAISRFFEMGLSVPEVALISGHKDTRMLFRYTHLRAEAVSSKLAEHEKENIKYQSAQTKRYTRTGTSFTKTNSNES